MDDLAALAVRHAPSEGVHETAVPGLALIRFDGSTDRVPTLYRPAVCLIVQGAKITMLGEEVYRYDRDSHLVISVDLPVTGQVIEASPERPYLCIRVDLEPALLSELMLQQPPAPGAESPRGVHLSRTTPELVDAVARLVA